MSRYFILLFILSPFLFSPTYGQYASSPKREYRAVWLTTIEGLDWPKTKAVSKGTQEKQQQELMWLLDSLERLHINTVLFQTRLRGDVLYPSKLEPFARVLTGREGGDPGYDPLAFAVEECHKRGMQIHAWIVSLPLGTPAHNRQMGSSSLTKRKPNLCRLYKGNWYMEPALEETADYLGDLVEEIVDQYDVDGIHLDYIRYPDRPKDYPDAALYKRRGEGRSLGDWRRANITRIVRSIYQRVKEKKTWVRVSCAPLGKHSDLSRYSSKGWNSYETVYQEAQAWLNEGIMDILFPMLYFSNNDFYPFVLDWQEKAGQRHIVPGIGAYRLLDSEGGWSLDEIQRQLATSRLVGTQGCVLFRTQHLLEDTKGLGRELERFYRLPALVPAMDWMGKKAPRAPSYFSSREEKGALLLSWERVGEGEEKDPPIKYNLYASSIFPVDTEKGENIIALNRTDTCFLWEGGGETTRYWALTSMDAWGQESEPIFLQSEPQKERTPRWDYTPCERKEIGLRSGLYDLTGRLLHAAPYSPKRTYSHIPNGCYLIETKSYKGRRIELTPLER